MIILIVYDSSDKTMATLFLIDYGKEISCPVTELKPLPSDLKDPGLVVKVIISFSFIFEIIWVGR